MPIKLKKKTAVDYAKDRLKFAVADAQHHADMEQHHNLLWFYFYVSQLCCETEVIVEIARNQNNLNANKMHEVRLGMLPLLDQCTKLIRKKDRIGLKMVLEEAQNMKHTAVALKQEGEKQ